MGIGHLPKILSPQGEKKEQSGHRLQIGLPVMERGLLHSIPIGLQTTANQSIKASNQQIAV